MNKIYKTVWDHAVRTFAADAELPRSRKSADRKTDLSVASAVLNTLSSGVESSATHADNGTEIYFENFKETIS